MAGPASAPVVTLTRLRATRPDEPSCAGSTPAGVLRGAHWRAGAYHAVQSWSRLRTDA